MSSWRGHCGAFDRWGIELRGAEGFHAIGARLDAKVEYRRPDALGVADIEEHFDFIHCFGILHRVEDPLGLLRVLAGTYLNDRYDKAGHGRAVVNRTGEAEIEPEIKALFLRMVDDGFEGS